MISNSLMKLLSAALFVSIVAVLGWEAKKQVDQSTSTGPGGLLAIDGEASVERTWDDSNGLQDSRSRLAVGEMGATPSIEEISTISRVPWLTSEVNVAYADAESSTCRLLLPEVPVAPQLAALRPGSRGRLGRVPALTVGLVLDTASKRKLPAITIGKIESYFQEHRLSIEPTIYQSETNELYFGTECRAAFYQTRRPDSTLQPEPMVEEAIGRFRALGVLGAELAQDRRTLLLAFRYTKSPDRSEVSASLVSPETEFLFLHLGPDATARDLRLKAFVTSDSRQTLQQLAIPEDLLKSSAPMITATIRFDSTVLLGYYPASPVVTNVEHRSAAAISLDSLRFITADEVSGRPRSMEQILDDFSELARSHPASLNREKDDWRD